MHILRVIHFLWNKRLHLYFLKISTFSKGYCGHQRQRSKWLSWGRTICSLFVYLCLIIMSRGYIIQSDKSIYGWLFIILILSHILYVEMSWAVTILSSFKDISKHIFFLNFNARIRLHTKNQFPGLPGSALKIGVRYTVCKYGMVPYGNMVGWWANQLLSLPTRVEVELSCENTIKFERYQ